MNFLGAHVPMEHQREDVERLRHWSRVNLFNDLGTGKTHTAAWLLFEWWMSGALDEAVLVVPGVCLPDWRSTLCGGAVPEGLVEFHDLRPPNHHELRSILTSKCRPYSGQLHVYATTYAGMRTLMGRTRGRNADIRTQEAHLLSHVMGRRVAIVVDEAQRVALEGSAQGRASRALAAAASHVISMTATPIGNVASMRLWGLARLVRPDVVRRMAPPGSFVAFKRKYGILVDPKQRADPGRVRFSAQRAFVVDVHEQMMRDEILGTMAPYTASRRKDECLDLPDKVHMMRYAELPDEAFRLMVSLADEDRAIMDDGHIVIAENVLVERLRTIEITGGWLEGRPVHCEKLRTLVQVRDEIWENLGDRRPICVWASRSREVVACALVMAGVEPTAAQRMATDAFPPDGPMRAGPYRCAVLEAADGGAAIIHGPTSTNDRDRIQDGWRAGMYHTCVAHPGVAGAGLNWQHVYASIYYSQPLGSISRRQSEDRHHRHGLDHQVLYYDVVCEDGPDEAVSRAHIEQRDAALAMLEWLRGVT